ncbi:unnamed protein product [Notodromas monacha]|uniref:Uncharacterized protein n=1 Tax=Notodromas monacha TaxID=399045 RepID=A0A7R9BZ27_9CRUS|nr:unnamed protein product [Notodromas monacha]CAG0924319.1 unnamed protein product [Notodromas monacha]
MNYIVPFVPHLFTKRTEDEAYIVAVTFRGVLGQTDFLDCIRNMTEDEFLSKAKAKLREIENGPEMKRFHGSPGTLVTKYSESGPKSFGKYLRRVLMAGAPFQPGLISCEYTFPEELTNSDTQDTPDLKLDCEQYIYILHAPVRFIANDYNSILEPGSSLIIKKNVRHGFSPAEKGKPKIISFQMDDKDSDAWGIVALSLQFAGEKGAARIRRNSKHWSN